jgi:hypothetical protein
MFGWFRKYVRKIGIFGFEVEFHPPTQPTAPAALEANSKPERVAGPTTGVQTGEVSNTPLPEGTAGLSFEAVIRAIREHYPEAVLGRTAEAGQYFERARHLTNYHLHTSDPPCYTAVQPNGKTMWLYLGRGGKICCGDKE